MLNKSMTILLADDDEEDLELIEDAILGLEPRAELHKHTNGKEVIEFLHAQPDHNLPCLIILDYNMPELNGSQILSHMSEHPRYESIPKVILSTSGAAIHVHECIANGAAEYFVKPNNMSELKSIAEKMLSFCRNS
jgi:CheY-like chemotaxis protein